VPAPGILLGYIGPFPSGRAKETCLEHLGSPVKILCFTRTIDHLDFAGGRMIKRPRNMPGAQHGAGALYLAVSAAALPHATT
jgi:hypothetical protein